MLLRIEKKTACLLISENTRLYVSTYENLGGALVLRSLIRKTFGWSSTKQALSEVRQTQAKLRVVCGTCITLLWIYDILNYKRGGKNSAICAIVKPPPLINGVRRRLWPTEQSFRCSASTRSTTAIKTATPTSWIAMTAIMLERPYGPLYPKH